MGQRTQIWIEDQQLQSVSDENGKVTYKEIYKNYCFHEQWGYGKGLVNRLINILNRLTMETYDEYSNGIDWNHFLSHDTDLMREYRDDMFTDDNGVNVSDYQIKKVPVDYLKNFLYDQDNNDGYMIVRLGKEKDPNGYSTNKYLEFGFYLRDYDTKTLKYITLEEYLRKYGIEPAYVKFAMAAVEYYSQGEVDLLIRDVLSTWGTPLSEISE